MGNDKFIYEYTVKWTTSDCKRGQQMGNDEEKAIELYERLRDMKCPFVQFTAQRKNVY